ncbi:HEPN domain-containing protein [Streptomyces zhihengii]|uniref:ApeA N-terminal domain-containing protein n=1 Tax=Streptomyces zhihengii TaxID=1818004 RepID=A0ABS2V574_9ACTN|nr:HEPN domain-containing protein [Streptomyces zhihengii]MBM9624763.1 hypothetical protein [Streptomyces zhihengii]
MPESIVPLRLPYEPDNYLCTWTVPDGRGGIAELPGNLKVLPNRPPTGSIYGSVPLNSESPGVYSFPQVVEFCALAGTLANGGSVVLLDASITYWSMGQGHISGSAALLGKGREFFGRHSPRTAFDHASDVPLISSVKFQVTALDAVIGISPIKSVQTPGIHPENPKDLWSANLDLEAKGKWEVEDLSLTVGYEGRMRTMDGYEFRLAFSPVAELKVREGASLRVVMDEFVEPLRRIICIATGKVQDLTYVSVELMASSGVLQVFGTGIDQKPFASSSNEIRSNSSAVRAKNDDLSLLDLILKWRQYAATHHPLVETYGSMLHARDQHPRSRFLLLIQALEGLHGHEMKDKYNRRKMEHLSKRESVIVDLKDKVDSDTMRFLKKSLLKNPPTSLESALNATVSDLPVNSMHHLAKTALVADVISQPPAPTTAASALRVVRNNLAHGNRGYEEHKLDEVVRILELIVRAHSLRILGCPDAVIERVFKETK